MGSTGLTSLLLVAPDAPLTPAAFALLAGVDVRKLAAAGSEQLYEISGLENGPNRVVYGLIGDAFVVASSADLAREIAAMKTQPAPEAATRIQVDIAALLERARPWLGSDGVRAVRALVSAVDVSASAKDGDVVGDAEVRWARSRSGSRYRAAARPVQARQPPSLFLIVGLPGAGRPCEHGSWRQSVELC